MSIPATKQINTGGTLQVPTNGELFCFHIEKLGTPTYLNDFFGQINDHLPSYVFNRATISTHEDRLSSGATTTSVLERARAFLQQTRQGRSFDSGELAEFLLFLFAKHVKGAHKLATKVHARGSRRITVPGRDNTYASMDTNGDIFMLLGEAKSKAGCNEALKEAQEDLNKFWAGTDIVHEINLASTHIRQEMTEDNAKLFEAFFIDDNPSHQKLKYKNIVLVGYSLEGFKSFSDGSITEQDFIDAICTNIQKSLTNQKALIDASPYPGIYCFVPFECIDSARDMFSSSNNLTI